MPDFERFNGPEFTAKLADVEQFVVPDTLLPEIRTRFVAVLEGIDERFFDENFNARNLPDAVKKRAITSIEEAQESFSDVFIYPSKYIDESKFEPVEGDTPETIAAKKKSKEDELATIVELLMNVSETYRVALESSLKKSDGALPPQPPVEKATSQEYSDDAFKNEIIKKTGNPNFFTELADVNSILDSGNINASYPRKRMGQPDLWNTDKPQLLERVIRDYDLVKKLLDQINQVAAYVGSDDVGMNKLRFINNDVKKTLEPLEVKLRDKKDSLQLDLEKDVVSSWERNPNGKLLFATQEKLIQRVESNSGFSSLAEAQKLEIDLLGEYAAATNNLTTAIQTLSEQNPPPGTVDRLRSELNSKFIDSKTRIFTELHKQALDNWKNQYLESVVFKSIRGLESLTPGTLAEFKKNYSDRSTEIAKLKSDKANTLAKIPNDPTIRTEADTYFDAKIAGMEASLKSLTSSQYDHWLKNEASELNNPMKVVKEARDKGKTVAAGGSESDVVAAIAELDKADGLIESTHKIHQNEFIDVTDHKDKLSNWVTDEKAKNETVKEMLRKRKTQAATETVKMAVDAKVASATATIKFINDESFDLNAAKVMGLDPLRKLRSKLKTELNDVPASEMSSLHYKEALSKIDSFEVEVEFHEMEFSKVADEILATANIPVRDFLNDTAVGGLNNDRHVRLLKKLKEYWISGPEAGKERDYKKQRTRVFAHMAMIETDIGRKHPAGLAEKIFEFQKKYGITRDEITEGITSFPGVIEMLDEMIEIVAKPNKDPLTGNVNPLAYDNLLKNPDSETVLKNFAKDKFLQGGKGGGSLPPEYFKAAWDLYYAYDLLSISLAKRQRETQTRTHNQAYSVDPNSITRPMHFAFQERNKGGKVMVGNVHILEFVDKLPPDIKDDPVNGWYGVKDFVDPVTHEHALGLETIQKLIKLRTAAIYPNREDPVTHLPSTDSAVTLSALKPSDWSAPWFPDNFNYLTEPDLNKIPADVDTFVTARDAFGEIINEYILSDQEGFSDPEHLFIKGGKWEKLGTAIGKVVVVDGNHMHMIDRILTNWMGMSASKFKNTSLNARHELDEKFREALQIATRYKKLPGLMLLKEYLSYPGVKRDGTFWSDQKTYVAPLLRPYAKGELDGSSNAYEARKAYLDLWITAVRHKSIPDLTQRGVFDEDIQIYREALGSKFPPVQPQRPLPKVVLRNTAVKKAT